MGSPIGQPNSKNTYIRENVCIKPSSTSMIQTSSSPRLGNMKLSHRRETIGVKRNSRAYDFQIDSMIKIIKPQLYK